MGSGLRPLHILLRVPKYYRTSISTLCVLREFSRRDGHQQRIVALFVLGLLHFKVNRIVDVRIEKRIILTVSQVLSLHDGRRVAIVGFGSLLFQHSGTYRCQVKKTFVFDGTIRNRRDVLLALPCGLCALVELRAL